MAATPIIATALLSAAAAAQPGTDGTLALSPVAVRTACTGVQAELRNASGDHDRAAAYGAGVLPATHLRLSRVTCVTERLLALSAPSANKLDAGTKSGAIGYLVIRERRTLRSVAGPRAAAPAFAAGGGDAGGFRRATAELPASSMPAAELSRSASGFGEAPEMLPRDPDDIVTAALPSPRDFDYVATPRELSYAPAPGAESRFDPQKRNGDLRKGIRWLTRLITGEEQ